LVIVAGKETERGADPRQNEGELSHLGQPYSADQARLETASQGEHYRSRDHDLEEQNSANSSDH
jgi:hypothetical protein